uniref:FAS-associated factor 1-like n=1 Tax=Sinocyclocheilus anshuiensis TaxID=1608454 RepID=A0A671P318_9TELE
MDREMILADFQACTGIDNIAEAITLLELNNWDLVAAINGVIPQENGILQRYDVDLLILMNLKPSTQAFLLQDNAPPSSASPSRHIVERQSRMLSFRVEYRQRSTEVVLEDASTVGDIKSILETELQVPVSKMQLKGWKSGDVSDSTVLQSLHLPKNNSLYVLTPDIAPSASTSQSSSAQQGLSSQNYLLVISHREAQRDYSLHFPASKTIQEVKRNISDLTNIPVRHQQWDGWPASASDDSVCFLLSLLVFFFFYPVTIVHLNGVYWIICIDIFLHLPSVPENSENEGDALLHFTAEFSRRYGDCHPVFYIGSLEAASQEAFYGKARDRKLLAIYLHNDESVLSNVFCSQMMCADSIVSYLSQNFITWAWDVTKEANKARLLTMCTRHFGSVVAQTIRTYKTDQFPLLLIVMGKRTSNEVLNVIQGNTTVDELMMRLMGAMEIFTAQQQEDIKDEDEREAREMVKREQDEAYRLSLEADRKKREAQEREEAEQVRQERIRKEQEEEREAIRLSLEQALPPEPKEEGGEPISKLRIRTPSGKFLERQFLGSCKLQVLFDFVASKGYPSDEFKLLTTFPRRNVSSHMHTNIYYRSVYSSYILF